MVTASPSRASDQEVTPWRVLLVHSQRMLREGLVSRLRQEPDIQVVAEAGSGEEALALVAQTNPDIVVLDVRLQDRSGIELARVLRQNWPELKILMLSSYDFDQYLRAATRIGVEGYLQKESSQEAMAPALREIARGGVVRPSSVGSSPQQDYLRRSAEETGEYPEELTVRELEVLELLFQGLRNSEIAERLSISSRTVEGHVSSIMGKLGAQSRTDAVRIAVQLNLIK